METIDQIKATLGEIAAKTGDDVVLFVMMTHGERPTIFAPPRAMLAETAEVVARSLQAVAPEEHQGVLEQTIIDGLSSDRDSVAARMSAQSVYYLLQRDIPAHALDEVRYVCVAVIGTRMSFVCATERDECAETMRAYFEEGVLTTAGNPLPPPPKLH